MTVFLFLYHFAWTFIIFFFLPVIPFIKNRRLLGRMGLHLPYDPPEKGGIWIHALSVGEVISAIPLVKLLSRKHPLKDIVFSVTTAQGMVIAREELEGEVKILLTMPLDFWWSIRRVVSYINPSLFVLVETDVWPGLIFLLKSRGINTVLVNGRISPRTYRSYRRFRFFTRPVLRSLKLWMMQSDLDRERLLHIGVGSDTVKTVGNIKFDRDWLPMDEKEYKEWLNILNLKPEDSVWVTGSTHQGEEDIILEVFVELRSIFPQLRIIIAPRRIERADDILRLCLDKGLRTVLKTEFAGAGRPYDVMILNTIGELGQIYGISKISFVGGSLVPIGGHNLLEPASFGRPVLFGSHTHNFTLMSRLLIEAGGGRSVKDREDLFETMKGLLSDPEKAKRMGRQAKEFVKMNKGALKRVVDYIEDCIDEKRD